MGSRIVFSVDDAIADSRVGLLGYPEILMPPGCTILENIFTMSIEGHWRIPHLIIRD